MFKLIVTKTNTHTPMLGMSSNLGDIFVSVSEMFRILSAFGRSTGSTCMSLRQCQGYHTLLRKKCILSLNFGGTLRRW